MTDKGQDQAKALQEAHDMASLHWKIQFDKAKWEQRGREMAQREKQVEEEGFHHQHHHVPLPVPHPTFLVFPKEHHADIDAKAREWTDYLKTHGYADAYLRVSVPSGLYVKFELLELRPEEKEQRLTLQEVAKRFERILGTCADVREVHALPLPPQTPPPEMPSHTSPY